MFIDLNPTLGMPLSAEARVQINFITKGLPTIKAVANLPNIVFPVLWFQDGVSSLPPNVIALLEKSTFYPKVAKISILSVVFVMGSILFIFGVIALIYYLKSVRQSKVFTTKETSTGSTPINGSVGSAGSGYSNPAVSSDNPDYVGL
ncbi:Sensory neuron membrane protein 2 [Armadillidium nasatum]|uniref:Scavenger receptor class B member 1 n=1 Tax=Armadillidium nasatum TaxID=96803 RepID=A0A5N5SV74_9CRUS|nr:Sensory neuron membrane protein 2 [Armadillidium nasatum]